MMPHLKNLTSSEFSSKDAAAKILPGFAVDLTGSRAASAHARRMRLLGMTLMNQQSGYLDYRENQTEARADEYMNASPWRILGAAAGLGILAGLIMVLDN
jgi:ElaB/YqjD/DUF883 family membrane-anchored ribosome-binding protein